MRDGCVRNRLSRGRAGAGPSGGIPGAAMTPRRDHPAHVEQKILPSNPFETLDRGGVGRLMNIAVIEGRQTRPDLTVGICGEHGGDPDSIAICEKLTSTTSLLPLPGAGGAAGGGPRSPGGSGSRPLTPLRRLRPHGSVRLVIELINVAGLRQRA